MIYDPDDPLKLQLPEEVSKYDEFYHKSGMVLQDRCGDVSDYLYFNVDYSFSLHDDDACHVLNHPCNLTQLIRENEYDRTYVNEAMLRPYPMEMVIKRFKTFYKQNVNPLLHQLRHKDIFIKKDPDHANDLLGEFCRHDDGMEALVTFWVPFLVTKTTSDDIAKFTRGITDALYVYGYNLSATNKQQTKVTVNGQQIDIIVNRLQFEAIYTSCEPKMAKTLYHVTPARFIEKIKQHGLVPSSKSCSYYYPDRVYLFNAANVKRVIRYGYVKTRTLKLKDSNAYTDDSHFYILKLDRDELLNYRYDNGKKRLLFSYDPCFMPPKVNNVKQSEAVFTYQIIPRELIQDTCLLYEVNDTQVKKVSNNFKFR